MSTTIDTGDVVKHAPTGEEWLVAYVRGGKVAWCGWPSGTANLSDCTLIEKATPEARAKLLRDLAAMSTNDHRRSAALEILQRERPVETPAEPA